MSSPESQEKIPTIPLQERRGIDDNATILNAQITQLRKKYDDLKAESKEAINESLKYKETLEGLLQMYEERAKLIKPENHENNNQYNSHMTKWINKELEAFLQFVELLDDFNRYSEWKLEVKDNMKAYSDCMNDIISNLSYTVLTPTTITRILEDIQNCIDEYPIINENHSAEVTQNHWNLLRNSIIEKIVGAITPSYVYYRYLTFLKITSKTKHNEIREAVQDTIQFMGTKYNELIKEWNKYRSTLEGLQLDASLCADTNIANRINEEIVMFRGKFQELEFQYDEIMVFLNNNNRREMGDTLDIAEQAFEKKVRSFISNLNTDLDLMKTNSKKLTCHVRMSKFKHWGNEFYSYAKIFIFGFITLYVVFFVFRSFKDNRVSEGTKAPVSDILSQIINVLFKWFGSI